MEEDKAKLKHGNTMPKTFLPLTKIGRQFQGEDGFFCAGHLHSLTYLSTICKYYSSSSTSAYICTRQHVGNSQKQHDIDGAKNGAKWQMSPNVGPTFSDILPTCHPTRQCCIKIGDTNIRQTQLSSFLGVKRNVKREWRTIHRAFGEIGLFSFAIEHTISMINMFIQHYGAGTTLAKKFTASLEALQLELGCTGNTLCENFNEKDLLATECWMKSFWERLHYYCFEIRLIYPLIAMPRQHDRLLVDMFLEAGYKGLQLEGLNRCRLALWLLFLLDITTACGRLLDVILLAELHCSQNHHSTFIFLNEKPSRSKWRTWLEFWTAAAGPGGSLNQPLGMWIGQLTKNGPGFTGHMRTFCTKGRTTG